MKRFLAALGGLVVILLVFALGVGASGLLRGAWGLPIFGTETETHDSQVIEAVQRTQQVALVSLYIQGIKETERKTKYVPFSRRKAFVQYSFNAKLGIDGSRVKVDKTGEHEFRLTVPRFIFIGYDRVNLQDVAEDGGVLGFVTGGVDRTKMIREVLDSSARRSYVQRNIELLRDQAQVFYETLINSVDPDATVSLRFLST